MNGVVYYKMREIGRGAFGVVTQCWDDRVGETVALKTIPSKSRYKDREVEILRGLEHGNVILLKEVFYEENNINIVMEYVPEDLGKFIHHFIREKHPVPLK